MYWRVWSLVMASSSWAKNTIDYRSMHVVCCSTLFSCLLCVRMQYANSWIHWECSFCFKTCKLAGHHHHTFLWKTFSYIYWNVYGPQAVYTNGCLKDETSRYIFTISSDEMRVSAHYLQRAHTYRMLKRVHLVTWGLVSTYLRHLSLNLYLKAISHTMAWYVYIVSCCKCALTQSYKVRETAVTHWFEKTTSCNYRICIWSIS